MGEYVLKEYCQKCGVEITADTRRYSRSKNDYYCARCAERLDSEYLIQHTCSVCKRSLSEGEHKMVLPSRVFGDAALPYVHRVMCMICYQKLGYRNRDLSVMRSRTQRIRANIRKSIAKRQIEMELEKRAVSAA